MSQQQRFQNTIIAILAISILFLTLITNGLVWKSPTVKVVKVQEAITLSDKEKTNLVIDELLTKSSAKCFRKILMVESHMNPHAKNPNSSARGMGQLLDTTYRNLGLQHSADPLAQVVATLAYISRHYGGNESVCKARQFQLRHNYY